MLLQLQLKPPNQNAHGGGGARDVYSDVIQCFGRRPVIVWYGTVNNSGWENSEPVILRAWSDGTIKVMKVQGNYQCQDLSVCGGGWTDLCSSQMDYRTDIDGNGAVELGDLLAVLSQWGQEAPCPDVVQLQCGLMEMN